MQAVKSGDPSQLQQAQLNIAQRRAGIRTPVGATPGGWGTPGASLLRTPGLGLTPGATPSMAPTMTMQTGETGHQQVGGIRRHVHNQRHECYVTSAKQMQSLALVRQGITITTSICAIRKVFLVFDASLTLAP